MELNPYAPPRAPPAPSPTPLYAVRPGQPWSAGQVFREATACFKNYWSVLVPAHLVRIALAILQFPILHRIQHAFPGTAAAGTFRLAHLVIVEGFLGTGLVRICLSAARGQPTSMRVLFGGGDRFLAMATLTFVLDGLRPLLSVFTENRVALHCAFAIEVCASLPGFWIAAWLVVDENRGPFNALGEAWKRTRGRRGTVFLTSALACLVGVGGCLFCGVGLLVSLPIAALMGTTLYVHVTGAEQGRAGPEPSVGRGGAAATPGS